MKRKLLYVLLVFVVLFGAAAGVTLFVANSEAGARWVLARIDAATGGNLNWAAADGTLLGGMRLADVALDDGSSLLQIQRLEFAWQPWRLLDGSLVLDRVDIVGLRHQSRVAGEPITEDALRDLLFELPIAVELRAFRVEDIVLTGTDGTMTALDSITGGAALDGAALSVTAVHVRQGNASVSGDVQLTDELEITGTLTWEAADAARTYAGTLKLAGALRQLEVSHELTQPVQLASRGTLVAGIFGEPVSFDVQHEFAMQTLAAFAQPDLQLQASVRTSGTPEQVSIGGTAQATVPEVEPLALDFALTYRDNSLAIDSAMVTSTQIGLRGNGQLELEPVSLRFDWALEHLDPGERLPQLQLSEVNGTGSLQLAQSGESFAGALQLTALNGTLNGHPLAVTGLINAADTGTATLELNAASGGNTLALTGDVGADLALSWDVQAPALDVLWQGLAGTVQGNGSITGPRDAPEVNGALSGALRFAADGDTLALDSFELAATYGAAGNDVNVEFSGLTRLADGVTTTLLQTGALTLTGTPARHVLRGNFRAPDDALQLSIDGAAAGGDWRGTVQSVTLDSRAGDWQLDAPFALEYTAGALTVAENCWTYLETHLCIQGGKPAGQGIDAQLALRALPLTWFNSAASATKPRALDELQDAFALNLPDGIVVEGELDAQASVRNLQGSAWDSLDVVLQPRALAVEITQQLLSDEVDGEPLRQRFGLEVNAGEVHSARSGNGEAWSGALDLRVMHIEDSGTTAQGTLRGSGELAADGTLAGSADLAFADLGWLEFLVPAMRDPAGTLNGTVGISGTRARPALQAAIRLNDGSFDLPVYGLQIRDTNLAFATDASNRLTLNGSARSGEGMLEVSAELTNPLQSTRAVTAQVNGANFLAFATDYATVHVSPQLQGGFAGELLTVNGSIEVADTEVDLEEVFGAGGSNAVRVSNDVVVVSGEQSVASTAQDSLLVAADLVVRVGENVHVSGYDLDANLSGELTLEQTPGRPILVYGELDIPEGRYEIYNQELNARDGRLVFFGNPANPLLDVRAFRETDNGEVGVLLTGNLDSIEGRLYSTPTLPDQEILALLVTGKSFGSVNAEESDALVGAIASFGLGRGEGITQRVGSTLGLDTLTVGAGSTLEDSALGLGKYLTPDILMRYKIGLFDRQSVLGIEYTLSERLKLEVETGISQSVDLNYTIEKD